MPDRLPANPPADVPVDDFAPESAPVDSIEVDAVTPEPSTAAPVDGKRRGAEPAGGRKRRAPRSTASRVLSLVGGLLMLAGVSLLAWVGWQMYGTNLVSQHKQATLVEEVQREWKQGNTTAKTKEGVVESIVRIPKFGKDYAVPLLEGVSDEALAAGYGRFPEAAQVGEKGNFALAAHRITHGEPLRNMPELQPGDEVIIETADATYTYVMDTPGDGLIVDFTQVWVVDPLPKNPDPKGVQPAQMAGQRLITLTTCSELFHTDNRMIAFGHLKSKEPRTA